jgi:ABC-2 type transport system ATP-binding protein
MERIEADRLTRSFGSRRVVDELSFAVAPREIFCFLGHNGAGKTTTIGMLTGQLQPTSGSARLMGTDVTASHGQVKPLFGVVFEVPNLYERLSVRANLAFAADLYKVDRQRIKEVLGCVGLLDRAGDHVRHLSNGMRQRLLIARAVLHEPKVLFLDEPTRGLDPGVAREIRGFVRSLAEAGMTVFLTTHYMEEADQLCDRVAILHEGRIIALDTPEKLKTIHGMRMVKATTGNGRTKIYNLDDPAEAKQLEEQKATDGEIKLSSEDVTLEQVFLKLTGRSLQK